MESRCGKPLWKPVEACGSLWKASRKPAEAGSPCGSLWKPVEACGKPRGSLRKLALPLDGVCSDGGADGLWLGTLTGAPRGRTTQVMRLTKMWGHSVWNNPAAGILNGYGGAPVYAGKSLKDAEAHTRWRIMSGLVELSSASLQVRATLSSSVPLLALGLSSLLPTESHASLPKLDAGSPHRHSHATSSYPPSGGVMRSQVSGQPAKRFAVDISELTAGYGTKRGDGAVRLQFLRVPIGSRLGSATAPSMAANNLPARMFDVKTPGTWVDASDGPRVTANGSYMGYCFLHAGDDNIKVGLARSPTARSPIALGECRRRIAAQCA